jgi:hypothetical protein
MLGNTVFFTVLVCSLGESKMWPSVNDPFLGAPVFPPNALLKL